MKVISETWHAHLIQYLHLYWCEVTGESSNVDIELSVNETFLE
jgi:hypothetical protein